MSEYSVFGCGKFARAKCGSESIAVRRLLASIRWYISWIATFMICCFHWESASA